MECNKDEAVRAKHIAEKKMENNDFEGAQKIAKKAQGLYPELENIMQLLTICDVHCSSRKMLFGSVKDWYEILQVERFSDELTIKKQYRRLALFLHPDKNRFPGAEAAFKLICEANAVLSDPIKKSLYDDKIRVSVRIATVNVPVHHIGKSSQFHNKNTAQANERNGFSSLNRHQAARSSFSVEREEFWTSCPFCKVRYKFHREFVNRLLHCQKCTKFFTAYEVSPSLATKWSQHGDQSTPSGPSLNQPAVRKKKDVSNQCDHKMNIQKDKGFSASHDNSHCNISNKKIRQGTQAENNSSGVQRGATTKNCWSLNGSASREPVKQEPKMQTGNSSSGVQTGNTIKINEDLKAEETSFCELNLSHGEKICGVSNGDAMTKESGYLKNKQATESSGSYDSFSQSNTQNMTKETEFGNGAAEKGAEPNVAHLSRRSTRKRSHVTYYESDDDVSDSLNGLGASKPPENSGDEQNVALDREDSPPRNLKSFQNGADDIKSKAKKMDEVHSEGRFQDRGTDLVDELRDRGKTNGMSGVNADAVEILSVSEDDSHSSDSHSSDDSKGGSFDVPEAEFNNFDRDRDESHVAVNQIWACYDSLDGMPRFYAKVKKVFKSPFKLSITWLEADPTDEAEKKWVEDEEPVGCGTFKLGITESNSRQRSLSHMMYWEKGQNRSSFKIHPRKSETWAIFKNWDITCRYNRDKPILKYEIVEVLSDFVADSDGIKVCYLDKFPGFVSIFHRTNQTESFIIGQRELYKFSHRIPSFKMSGSERGVPEGSFELDPASLPLDPDDLYYPSKAKVACTKSVSAGHGSSVESVKRNCKPPKPVSKRAPTEFVDLEKTEVEISTPRRSPRKMDFNLHQGNKG